jgi:hypothetical protein
MPLKEPQQNDLRRSAWLEDPAPESFRRREHPVVVRHERTEIVAKLQYRHEMNRVERANLERSQDTRCIQDAIVHANQIQLSSLIPWKLEIGSWELTSVAR